jgi:hypothetical protein
MQLLDPVHTEGPRPPIERWVAEELLLDCLEAFDGHRVEGVRRLMTGMPMPWQHRNMLAELLFSQMLALPRPRMHPLAYSTVMVDLCKVGGGSESCVHTVHIFHNIHTFHTFRWASTLSACAGAAAAKHAPAGVQHSHGGPVQGGQGGPPHLP